MDDKKTYLYNLEEKLNYYKEQLSLREAERLLPACPPVDNCSL